MSVEPKFTAGQLKPFQAWLRVHGGCIVITANDLAWLMGRGELGADGEEDVVEQEDVIEAAEVQEVAEVTPSPPPSPSPTSFSGQPCMRCQSIDVIQVSSCKTKCRSCGLEQGGCA